MCRLPLAGRHQHEAASAVGVLRLAGFEARLPQRRRLLVAQRSSDWDASEHTAAELAVDLRIRDDPWEHRLGDLERRTGLGVPAAGR